MCHKNKIKVIKLTLVYNEPKIALWMLYIRSGYEINKAKNKEIKNKEIKYEKRERGCGLRVRD